MPDGPVQYSQSANRRILDAVRRVEGSRGGDEAYWGRGPRESGSNIQFLRVTSGTPTSGLYPAILQDSTDSGVTWADLTASECWVKRIDGGTLTTGQVSGKCTGEKAADGKAIFTVVSGSGGTITVDGFDFAGDPISIETDTLLFPEANFWIEEDFLGRAVIHTRTGDGPPDVPYMGADCNVHYLHFRDGIYKSANDDPINP